jgi:hypothetical protein
MKALKTYVAEVDVHKDILAITFLIGNADGDPIAEQIECSLMTDDLRACRILLKQRRVKAITWLDCGEHSNIGTQRIDFSD